MWTLRLLLIVAAVFLAGCDSMPAGASVPAAASRAGISRPVLPVPAGGRALTVHRPIAVYEPWPPRRGFVFPVGAYELEAEDGEFWYFRSAVPMEEVLLEGRRVQGRRRLAGGIKLPKRLNSYAAAGYVDAGDLGKAKIWDFGSAEFWWLEGKYWTRNF